MVLNPTQSNLQKTIENLFNDLDSANLILKNPTIPEWAKKVGLRTTQTYLMINALTKIPNNKKWDEFAVHNASWFTPEQLETIYFNLVVFYVLDNLEYLTLIFQLVLDHSITYNNHKFFKNGTLGSYLKNFKLMFDNSDYEKIIDNKFRVVIAHSHWWYEKLDFCYDNNGTTIKLDFPSFFEKYLKVIEANWAIVFELKKRGMANAFTGDMSLQEASKLIAANK